MRAQELKHMVWRLADVDHALDEDGLAVKWSTSKESKGGLLRRTGCVCMTLDLEAGVLSFLGDGLA